MGRGVFSGQYWGTGEAIIGTNEGIQRACACHHVGGHGLWDPEGFNIVLEYPRVGIQSMRGHAAVYVFAG